MKTVKPAAKTTKPVKREKATSTKGHYVTNATLLPEVLRAKALGKITPALAQMLMLIAERYSRKSWFVGFSYREDMIAAAMVNLCNDSKGMPNALKFNPDKSTTPNPFSYYTTAIHNSFQQFKTGEKNQRNIRDALLVDAGSNPSFNFLQGDSDKSSELVESDNVEHTSIEKDWDELSEADLEKREALMAENPAVTKSHYRSNRAGGPVTVYKAKDLIQHADGTFEIKPKPVRKPRSATAKTTAGTGGA